MTDPRFNPNDPDANLADLIKRGASMEDMARLHDPDSRDPGEALRALQVGNARFFNGNSSVPILSPIERRSQVMAQTPYAVVLGCSDSRVPIEIVFDVGAGSLFVTRVVGSVVSPATLGSIIFAVRHLRVHVVMVLGHEGCGAVQLAMKGEEHWKDEPEELRNMLRQVSPAVRDLPTIRDRRARMREAVISNVRHQVHVLQSNPVVSAAKQAGEIAVVGAYYEMSSGAVDFLVSDEDLRP